MMLCILILFCAAPLLQGYDTFDAEIDEIQDAMVDEPAHETESVADSSYPWHHRPRNDLCYRKSTIPNCLKTTFCKISTPQKTRYICKRIRHAELLRKRQIFLLKTTSNKELAKVNLKVLALPPAQVQKYAMFDAFQSQHFNLYVFALTRPVTAITQAATKMFAGKDFTTYQEYFQVSEYFRRAFKLDKPSTPYFRVPRYSYKYYTNLEKGKRFLRDRTFVEQRFAGMNPLTIRRVTLRGKIGTNLDDLKKRINTGFGWEKAIKRITGKSLRKSIAQKLVYVSEFPILNGLSSGPDPYGNKSKGGAPLRNDTNPIAIFAVRRRGRRYDMKAVAIQIDNKPDAPVYQPKDGYLWQMAKEQVDICDLFVSQSHEHLLSSHYRIEPICVAIERHFSKFHPLHEIFKYHCRGTFFANSNIESGILAEGARSNLLFGFGSKGFLEILKRGYKTMVWDDINVINNIKERGMDDRRKVPFYPYRDDGKVLHGALQRFSEKLISVIYKTDEDVKRDYELQNFINEISVNGKRPPLNGLGNVKGLPGNFRCIADVEDFIAQFLWIPVHHAISNFPVYDFSGSAGTSPSRLYLDPRAESKKDFVYMLPGPLASIVQESVAHTLGTFHLDAMFDYIRELKDPGLRRVVEEAYIHLMSKVRPKLDARNAERMKKGYLTYPYMVPGWIPNGINV